MLRTTELDLARTGFTEGATITPEIAKAVRALLETKDTSLLEVTELAVTAEAFIQAIAAAACPPIPKVAPDIAQPKAVIRDRLLAEIHDLRLEHDAISWMHKGVGWFGQPTEAQMSEMNAAREEFFFSGVEVAKRQVVERRKAEDDFYAKQFAKKYVVNREIDE